MLVRCDIRHEMDEKKGSLGGSLRQQDPYYCLLIFERSVAPFGGRVIVIKLNSLIDRSCSNFIALNGYSIVSWSK